MSLLVTTHTGHLTPVADSARVVVLCCVAAMQDLEPSQLLLFIQSFGIPTASMGKLLCYLDHSVTVDSGAIEQLVVDKDYMIQLIDIQVCKSSHHYPRLAVLLVSSREIKTISAPVKGCNNVLLRDPLQTCGLTS